MQSLNRTTESMTPPRAVPRSSLRGWVMVVGGLLLPPVAFVVGVFVKPTPGMDGYVPAFIGGMAGALVGLVLVLLGIDALQMARHPPIPSTNHAGSDPEATNLRATNAETPRR